MQEIFSDISIDRKKAISASIDMYFKMKEPENIAKAALAYINMLPEEEKKFADFYFNLTLTNMKENTYNENYSN